MTTELPFFTELMSFKDRIFISRKNDTRNLILLSLLFFVIAAGVALVFGVKHVNDSHRYLEYATNLQGGFYFERHNFWYIGYVGFIYFVRLITNSSDPVFLIVSQYLYSWIAFILLYRTIRIFDSKGFSPLIGALLYFLFIEIMIWNAYILCESFYFNSVVIALYFLSRLWKGKRKGVWTVIAVVFSILLVTLSKPTGVLFLLAVFITFFMKFWLQSGLPKIGKAGVAVVLICVSVLMLNRMLDSFLIIENYQLGEVIYAITTLPSNPMYSGLVVEVPQQLNMLPETYSPLWRMSYFIFNNFSFWSELFFKKIYYFLLHVRPFWSMEHNALNILTLLPVYFLSFWQWKKSDLVVKVFAASYFILQTVAIGMTSVDWDGRFLVPVFPLLIILSALRINDLILNALKRVSNRDQ